MPHQDGGGTATLLESIVGVKAIFIGTPKDHNTISSNADLGHDWLRNIDNMTWEVVVIRAGSGL